MTEMDLDCLKKLNLKTRVDGYIVSTVKLICDHGFGNEPLWYETMIYQGNGNFLGDGHFINFQKRYRTKKQAEAGHESICNKLRDFGLKGLDL